MATHINGHRYNPAGICVDCKALKPAPKPSKQDELLKFVTDPKILDKAVEGSMEKRMARMQPSKLDDFVRKWVIPFGPDKDGVEIQAKADLLALIEEVIGPNIEVTDSLTADWVDGRNYEKRQIRLRKDNL